MVNPKIIFATVLFSIGLSANQGVMNYLDKHAHDKPATGFEAFLIVGVGVAFFIIRILMESDYLNNYFNKDNERNK